MVISIGKCGFKVPIFNDHISWKYPSWTIDDRIGHLCVQRSLSLLSCFGFASSQSIPMESQDSLRIAGCDRKKDATSTYYCSLRYGSGRWWLPIERVDNDQAQPLRGVPVRL
jgi:hypothetical protein